MTDFDKELDRLRDVARRDLEAGRCESIRRLHSDNPRRDVFVAAFGPYDFNRHGERLVCYFSGYSYQQTVSFVPVIADPFQAIQLLSDMNRAHLKLVLSHLGSDVLDEQDDEYGYADFTKCDPTA